MTDISDTSPSSDPVGKLERQTVLTAVTALCGADRAAAALLQKGCKRLVSSGNWSDDIKQLERFGLSARYLAGPLRDVLDMPGDLVLLRNTASGFTLLLRIEQRWQYLAEDGIPLPEEVNIGGGERVEAVVMSMPTAGIKSGGFSSLAAL